MKSGIVRKSNFLIEASYKLSVIEQKVILALITTLKAEDNQFAAYPFRIKDLVSLLGVTSPNEYKYLGKITKNLLERVLVLKTEEVVLQTHWLSSAKYIKGEGIVELKFDSEIKPFLLTLKKCFTNYPLRYALQLRSQFSIRLYELLKQYEKIGQRNFEVEDLKRLLGISSKQYQQYADFKKRVVLTAQKELAGKTDITFKFEEIKRGHGVGQIRFYIKSKTLETAQFARAETIQVVTPFLAIEPPKDETLEKLITILPPEYQKKESVRELLKTWLKSKNLDYVARNIKFANEGSNAVNPGVSLGKGSNYRNYLAKALKGDFGLAWKEDREAGQAQEEKARQEQKATALAARQIQEKIQREQEDNDRARVYRQSLPPEALEALKGEALAKMDPVHRETVARNGLGSEMLLKIAMDKICLERMKIAT